MNLKKMLFERLFAVKIAEIQRSVQADFKEHGVPKTPEEQAAAMKRITGFDLDPQVVARLMEGISKARRPR